MSNQHRSLHTAGMISIWHRAFNLRNSTSWQEPTSIPPNHTLVCKNYCSSCILTKLDYWLILKTRQPQTWSQLSQWWSNCTRTINAYCIGWESSGHHKISSCWIGYFWNYQRQKESVLHIFGQQEIAVECATTQASRRISVYSYPQYTYIEELQRPFILHHLLRKKTQHRKGHNYVRPDNSSCNLLCFEVSLCSKSNPTETARDMS